MGLPAHSSSQWGGRCQPSRCRRNAPPQNRPSHSAVCPKARAPAQGTARAPLPHGRAQQEVAERRAAPHGPVHAPPERRLGCGAPGVRHTGPTPLASAPPVHPRRLTHSNDFPRGSAMKDERLRATESAKATTNPDCANIRDPPPLRARAKMATERPQAISHMRKAWQMRTALPPSCARTRHQSAQQTVISSARHAPPRPAIMLERVLHGALLGRRWCQRRRLCGKGGAPTACGQ